MIGASSLLAVMAAGCGADESDPTPSPTATAAPTSRVVHHKFGETEVPVSPQRVVSVGWDEHDLILTFGVIPIMQRDSWGDQPYGTWLWAQPALGDARPELITDSEEIPYERILAMNPDLVMATWAGIDQETYARLSEIAPTVAQHPDYEDWETPWDARALQVGAVFGKEAEARALVDAIESRIVQIREDHPEWQGLEAVTVTLGEGTFAVAMEGHSRGKLMLDLGFAFPPEIVAAAGGESHAEFSRERLSVLDCDLVLWVNGQDDPSPIVDLPLRSSLDAHTQGREVYCDKVLTAAFSIQSPLSFNFLLDALVPEIEAAIDGDPTTTVELAVEYGVAP